MSKRKQTFTDPETGEEVESTALVGGLPGKPEATQASLSQAEGTEEETPPRLAAGVDAATAEDQQATNRPRPAAQASV